MNLRGLFIAKFVYEGGDQKPVGVGNLYRLMRGYAEGGYVGGAGSPAQMRRAEGVVLQSRTMRGGDSERRLTGGRGTADESGV